MAKARPTAADRTVVGSERFMQHSPLCVRWTKNSHPLSQFSYSARSLNGVGRIASLSRRGGEGGERRLLVVVGDGCDLFLEGHRHLTHSVYPREALLHDCRAK